MNDHELSEHLKRREWCLQFVSDLVVNDPFFASALGMALVEPAATDQMKALGCLRHRIYEEAASLAHRQAHRDGTSAGVEVDDILTDGPSTAFVP